MNDLANLANPNETPVTNAGHFSLVTSSSETEDSWLVPRCLALRQPVFSSLDSFENDPVFEQHEPDTSPTLASPPAQKSGRSLSL